MGIRIFVEESTAMQTVNAQVIIVWSVHAPATSTHSAAVNSVELHFTVHLLLLHGGLFYSSSPEASSSYFLFVYVSARANKRNKWSSITLLSSSTLSTQPHLPKTTWLPNKWFSQPPSKPSRFIQAKPNNLMRSNSELSNTMITSSNSSNSNRNSKKYCNKNNNNSKCTSSNRCNSSNRCSSSNSISKLPNKISSINNQTLTRISSITSSNSLSKTQMIIFNSISHLLIEKRDFIILVWDKKVKCID